MAHSLADLLAEHGIKLKRMTGGHNEHIRCVKCGGGKTREESLSVTIDSDAAGATWVCHRGGCGWTGGGKTRSSEQFRSEPQKPVQKPPPHTPAQQSNRPQWLWEFFDERNIGAKTVQHFGVYAGKRYFGETLGEADAIVFPYVVGGEIVNRKYRPYPAKNPQMQEKDALQTLFNIDSTKGKEAVIFVEGEPDVMALFESGATSVVTLKDGAPAKVNSGNEKRFAALATHADILGPMRKIILAGDNDPPGLALQEELAQRLGRHRCWMVTWPEGCKDACDVLRAHGPEAVMAALKAAKRYPIEGLHHLQPGQLVRLRQQPAPPILSTGIPSVDKVMALPAEGRLIVVTGYPASGKTSWVRAVMIHTAAEHGRRWTVFSPEMQPWEMFMAECAEVLMGAPFWADENGSRMTDQQAEQAERWLSERVLMLSADSEETSPTVEWIIERARYAILSHGTTDLLIDPWNELEHTRGDQTETDYIGRSLQKLKAFGLRHSVNVWVIAHPAKPVQLRGGEKRQPPGPYDISGSANWANKTDLGITIHQPDGVSDAADLVVWKSRFRRWGKKNATAPMVFDPSCGRYSSASGGPLFDHLGGDHP